MKSEKVINDYKVVTILAAYENCIEHHHGKAKEALKIPVVESVIKAKNFEDIDTVELRDLLTILERFPLETVNDCYNLLLGIYTNISDKDFKLLKKLGLDISEKVIGKVDEETSKVSEDSDLGDITDPIERKKLEDALKHFREFGERMDDWDEIKEMRAEERERRIEERNKRLKEVLGSFFIDKNFYSHFLKDINSEFERREKELNKMHVTTGTSMDDSVLDAFKNRKRKAFLEKIEKDAEDCKDFNELKRLLLLYTTGRGCDYMNGFLRGDMSAIKAIVKPVDESEEKGKKEEELKPNLRNSSWNTDLNVDIDLLLDTALNAFKLRKGLAKGIVEEVTELYKGISLDRIKRAVVGLKDSDTMEKVMEYINKNKPIYKTREFTSTSTLSDTADAHARRSENKGKAAIMKIKLNPGTVFGKDLNKTVFGKDQESNEVVLMSNQKIKLNKAKMKGDLLEIECETKK